MRIRKFFLILTVNLLWIDCLASCCPSNKTTANKKAQHTTCNDWIHPDPKAYEELGARLTDVLINAKTINVYSLTPKEKINSDDYELDANFVRDKWLCKLTKGQATVLAYNLISNGANYHKDSTLIIMSPYYPIIEFEFIKKKEVAHVIISLSNYTWAIKYDDKIMFKYNYASGTFTKRFCDYFLNKQKDEK
jgi:hypothetical protein